MDDVDRLVARAAPGAGPGMTPLAWELMEEITSLPVPPPARPRRRRRWLAVPAIAVLALVLTWIFPVTFGVSPASAALDIRPEGGYYVITVKNLLADPEVYQSELQARGLNISLRLMPTSSSMAGSMFVVNDVDLLRAGKEVPAEGPIKTISAPGRCGRPDGCPIGVKVPIHFRKKAEIMLGRQARPGERYVMPPNIDRPGEPLHCVAFVNKTVVEIVPMLRERGVEAAFTFYGAKRGQSSSVPGSWYVQDGVMSAIGKALILAGPEPNPRPRPMDDSCRGARD